MREQNKTRFALVLLCLGCVIIKGSDGCGWGQWINDNKPTTKPFPEEVREGGIHLGGGDMEQLDSSKVSAYCSTGGKITQIECQDSSGIKSTDNGQTVICDISRGLKCLNRYNHNNCSDYKIRYLCDCTGLANTPKPSGHGRTGGAAGFGFSHTRGGVAVLPRVTTRPGTVPPQRNGTATNGGGRVTGGGGGMSGGGNQTSHGGTGGGSGNVGGGSQVSGGGSGTGHTGTGSGKGSGNTASGPQLLWQLIVAMSVCAVGLTI